MAQIKVFGSIIAVCLILIVGQRSDGNGSEPPLSKPVNIIVILDTSDRISNAENPGQLEKDIAIMKGIVSLLAEILLNEIRTLPRKTWLRHHLAFVVPDQKGATPIPQDIIGKLKFRATAEDKPKGAPRVREMIKELLGTVDKLDHLFKKENTFTGSDIWKWFRASGKAYLKKDMQNHIICLSDGYLDFNKNIQNQRPIKGNKTSYIPYDQIKRFRKDPNWEENFESEGHGLLEIGQDFRGYDVKFLMVEIKLRTELDPRAEIDLPILKKYWRTWLESMGINDSEFMELQADPQIVKDEIERFIRPVAAGM